MIGQRMSLLSRRPSAQLAVLRTAVHEAPGAQVPTNDCPTAGVRLICNDQSETNGKADRAKNLWNAGVWSWICMKTHWTTESTGPSQQYNNEVIQALGRMDTGGVQRGEIWEVGNEPNDDVGKNRLLRALAGSQQTIRDSGRKVVMAHVLNGTAYVADQLDSPSAICGNANWGMVDGWALHAYADSPSSIISSAQGLRNLLDNRGHPEIPIYITENGWPRDRLGFLSAFGNTGFRNYTAQEQADKADAMWTQILTNAATLNLRCWTWFAYNDYTPTNANWDHHCGVVELDDRPNSNYDGRAKGAATGPGPPPPYGLALAKLRSLPKETTINV